MFGVNYNFSGDFTLIVSQRQSCNVLKGGYGTAATFTFLVRVLVQIA
jgi:hypothetical protein